MLDKHVRLWYIAYHNGDTMMTNIYANVGKMGNLARSLLLYIQKTVFAENSLPDFSITRWSPRPYAKHDFLQIL